MDEIKDRIIPVFKSALMDALGAEELIVEAAKDLIRDEIKRHIRNVLDANPTLREEFKECIRLYFDARMKQAYANIKLAKATAKLGLEIIPEDLRENLTKEFLRVFEKEVTSILDRAL